MPIRHRKLAGYVLVFAFAFFFLFARSASVNPIELQVIQTFSWPLKMILAPINEAKKIIFYHQIYNEYLKSRKEVDSLKRKLVAMDEAVRENTRLNQLLGFKRKALFGTIAANVIVREPSTWNSSLVIDRGSVDGIAVGMPVVNALGVVGKIVNVNRTNAKVMLLTDPGFSVAALVQRSREVGLVSGSLRGLCRLRYLSDKADVQAGDVIVTSKFSSSFPDGLLVGEVIEVFPSEEIPQPECLVKPAVNFSQLEEVLVLKPID